CFFWFHKSIRCSHSLFYFIVSLYKKSAKSSSYYDGVWSCFSFFWRYQRTFQADPVVEYFLPLSLLLAPDLYPNCFYYLQDCKGEKTEQVKRLPELITYGLLAH